MKNNLTSFYKTYSSNKDEELWGGRSSIDHSASLDKEKRQYIFQGPLSYLLHKSPFVFGYLSHKVPTDIFWSYGDLKARHLSLARSPQKEDTKKLKVSYYENKMWMRRKKLRIVLQLLDLVHYELNDRFIFGDLSLRLLIDNYKEIIRGWKRGIQIVNKSDKYIMAQISEFLVIPDSSFEDQIMILCKYDEVQNSLVRWLLTPGNRWRFIFSDERLNTFCDMLLQNQKISLCTMISSCRDHAWTLWAMITDYCFPSGQNKDKVVVDVSHVYLMLLRIQLEDWFPFLNHNESKYQARSLLEKKELKQKIELHLVLWFKFIISKPDIYPLNLLKKKGLSTAFIPHFLNNVFILGQDFGLNIHLEVLLSYYLRPYIDNVTSILLDMVVSNDILAKVNNTPEDLEIWDVDIAWAKCQNIWRVKHQEERMKKEEEEEKRIKENEKGEKEERMKKKKGKGEKMRKINDKMNKKKKKMKEKGKNCKIITIVSSKFLREKLP